MTECAIILEWSAAHRVLGHEGPCITLHGHDYRAEVVCRSEDGLDDVGRVIDFGVVRQRVGDFVQAKWDHTTLVNASDTALLKFCTMEAQGSGQKKPYVFDCEPTAENIAEKLLELSNQLLDDTRAQVIRVRVWETPYCYADAYLDD